MEELGKRILEGRAFQKKVVGMMLSVLARALKVCRSLDPMVRGEIDTFPEDFVFILGIYGSRHPVILQNRSRGLSRIYESVEAVCQKIAITPSSVAKRLSADRSDPQRVLEVRFKSVEAGWRMVTGQISAEGAWARHDLLINGEIAQAMRFLRCIQRAQAYLIPAGMANQVLPLQEPLPVKRWRVWLRMLHVKKRKPGEQED